MPLTARASREWLLTEQDNDAQSANLKRLGATKGDNASDKEVRAGAQRRQKEADAKKADQQKKGCCEQELKRQRSRSGMLAHAGKATVGAVKRGIWEDGAEVAGGEIIVGTEDTVPAPNDPTEI